MYPFELQTQPDSRLVAVDVFERDVDSQAANAIQALATFQLRQRDALDFTVDFTAWLSANGPAQLSNGEWALAPGSPKEPDIVGQAFSPLGKITAVVKAPAGSAPGDAYWFDVTATIAAVTAPSSPSDAAIAARTMTRRVNIVVVAG